MDVVAFREQYFNGHKKLFGVEPKDSSGPQWMQDILKYVYQGSPMRGQQFYRSDTVSPMKGQEFYLSTIVSPMKGQVGYRSTTVSPMKGQEGYRSDIKSPMRGQQSYISDVKSPMRGWGLKSLVEVTYHGGTAARSAFAGFK